MREDGMFVRGLRRRKTTHPDKKHRRLKEEKV